MKRLIHKGFRPIATPGSRVLVLGSLPGPESLRRRQYYAQPRNAFWRIVSDLFGTGPLDDYPARVAAIERHGLALWDVCASAERTGALDSAIRRASVEVNDFEGFLRRHRAIERVCCNGQTAALLYRRLVLPGLPAPASDLPVTVLPSTSPAHAAISYERKLAAWAALRPGARANAPNPQGRGDRQSPSA